MWAGLEEKAIDEEDVIARGESLLVLAESTNVFCCFELLRGTHLSYLD